MSGTLSRSVSLSPVDAPATGPLSLGLGSVTPISAKEINGRIPDFSVSPLKIFVLAKKKINDVFGSLREYTEECHAFVFEMGVESEVATQDQLTELEKTKHKITGISDVLQRDHMKVVFFGRTSNGKSTVVNAMLQDKILPSGLGHTTNCFLQIEGSENNEAYLLTEDSTERKNVKSVTQLAHALSSEKLGESMQVRIIWPKDKCPLLRDDVVLVDSPGIDVSPNLDEWIDKYCLDADVFVLVANAESTLMLTEKNFFHKVNEKLSKPNIFILNNRWDASASEPEYSEGVRKQHLERTVSFLADELHVVSRQQAEDRVFFVSAKEVLQARLKQQQGLAPSSGALADGFQSRFFEFQDFERKFEECLSKSAVKTKFEQHAQRGTVIVQNVQLLMDTIFNKATDKKKNCMTQRKEQKDRLEVTAQQMEMLTEDVKMKIGHLVEAVEQKVAGALSEEITRLSVLVQDFERPFQPDNLVLSVYKKELHSHVEQGLSSNLRNQLSSSLTLTVERAQKDMTEGMSALLPAEHRAQLLSIMSRNNFDILYRLNCENLCSEFKEDLEFRFSLGLMNLVSRFLGPRGTKMAFCGGGGDTVPRPVASAPQSPSKEAQPVIVAPSDYLAIVQKVVMLSPTSQTAVGTLALTGFLVKSVGWRIIALTMGLYGLMYLYERLTWTNKAKERAFKKQYVEHATDKLRMIVSLTSANCSHQVQQELSSTYARLCHLADDVANDLQVDIRHLDKEINMLESAASNARRLKNKAVFLSSELDTFCQQYLHYNK